MNGKVSATAGSPSGVIPRRPLLGLAMVVALLGSGPLCLGCSGPDEEGAADGSDASTASGATGNSSSPRPPGEPTPLGEGVSCVLGSTKESNQGVKIDVADCEERTLPGTGATYCIVATPECSTAGAGCPLYIVSNMATFADRIQYPESYGRLIDIKISPGQLTPESLAELPRQIAKDYPGLDTTRVYAMGWSIGGHKMKVAFIKSKQGFDTPYGSLLGLYAGFASMGISVEPTDNYAPMGKLHVIQIAGRNDDFAKDGADPSRLAVKPDCSETDLVWRSVGADDPLMIGNGTDAAEKATFGDCPGGDVVAYRFKDEGHELKFSKHFDPSIRALNIAWNFFQGRTTGDDSFTGSGAGCVTR